MNMACSSSTSAQLIYRSLWSEMLDDRKFYFPIKPEEPQAAAPAQGGPFRNMQLRKWHPIGPDDAVVMDKEQPFVGEQSPRIELDASTPHGIRQSGFALVKGKKYTGHIWLRATAGAKVKVALVWGEGANDRQTLALPTPPGTYQRNALHIYRRRRYRRRCARDSRHRRR